MKVKAFLTIRPELVSTIRPFLNKRERAIHDRLRKRTSKGRQTTLPEHARRE